MDIDKDIADKRLAYIAENTMQVMLAPSTNAYLDQLAATNLYGNTRVTVAIALIDEGIRNALKNGFIDK